MVFLAPFESNTLSRLTPFTCLPLFLYSISFSSLKAMAKDASKSKPLIQQIPGPSQKDSISQEEKERLLQQSGLLKRVKKREAELQTTTAQYVWQAIFMTIPFGFLLGAFDITVKIQYSEPWSYVDMLTRALRSAPGK